MELDLTASICPRGWVLPEFTEIKSFASLTSTYLRLTENTSGLASSVEENFRAAPTSFVRSGEFNIKGALNRRGRDGYYWSSKASNVTSAYRLDFSNTEINIWANTTKAFGHTLRCVAR